LQSNNSWNKVKAEVHKDNRKLGIKFTVNKTIPKFKKGAKKINLNYSHSFVEFKNVLQSQYKTSWKQVVHEKFPVPADLEMIPAEQDHSSKANFCHAVELFIKQGSSRDELTRTAVHLHDTWW
jgi:hypothetical protein